MLLILPVAFLAIPVAGSATFKLVDPITNEFVGQALMDFLPDSFMKALKSEHTPIGHGDSGFPIIITPEPDVSRTQMAIVAPPGRVNI